MINRILKMCGYSPDKQETATQTILKQVEVLCGEWAEDQRNNRFELYELLRKYLRGFTMKLIGSAAALHPGGAIKSWGEM